MFLTKHAKILLLLVLALCCLTNASARRLTRTPKDQASNKKSEELEKKPADAAAASDDDDDDDDDDKVVKNKHDADKDDDDDEENNDDDDDDDEEDEKQAQQALKTALKNALPESWASTSFASTVNSLWNWFGKGLSESFFGGEDKETKASARTFGKIRRLQMALIPIIFKFGILSAMVAFLVAIGMKSLFLLKVLIFMNAAAILGKFLTFKSGLGEIEHASPPFSYNGWNPHVRESSWSPTAPAVPSPHGHPTKEIHLHIHGGQAQLGQLAQSGQSGYNYDSQGWQSRADPYGAYAPTAVAQVDQGQSDLPNNTDPFSMLPTKYPTQHLSF